jgi:hypothetical protein
MRLDDVKLTISLIHGTFNCDQARIDDGSKFGGHLPRNVADLRMTYVLHSNGISKISYLRPPSVA